MEPVIAPTTHHFQRDGGIPNNPVLPVLVYRKVFDPQTADKDKKFQRQFDSSGWKGVWKNGLYDYHHFHSASHEALGIASGSADVLLGGEHGTVIKLEAGDLIVLPAGTGHKRVSASENLVVMGAYPEGQQDYDVCRGKEAHLMPVEDIIAAVPLPDTDPFYGATGPLLTSWRRLES
jgi:uncharacterized protein YjlB